MEQTNFPHRVKAGINFGIPKLLFTLFFLLTSFVSLAQQQINGIVRDEQGIPIAGASVAEKNTSNGVVTNFDGEFEMSVASSNAAIVISYIGFTNSEVKVGTETTFDITLKENLQELDEVVVIGYGTQKKADVTSAVATVKSEDFVQGNVKDAAQLIQGKVAGLTVSAPSGDPTQSSQIKLRGTSSLSGGTNPLVLVDGVPGSLGTVAPEDIESIDVLKDGSATAIYGTRGTNGVIIITTKKGNYNAKPSIEYNGYSSLSTIARQMDFLDAGELRQKYAEGYTFVGANLQDFGHDTDWLDEITRDAVSQVHNLIFRGGNDATNITASINYRDLEGIFDKSETEKYTGRISVNHAMFDNKLKTNVAMIASEQVYNALGDGTSFDPYIYRQAIIRNPTEPVYDDNGNWFERDVYFYDNPVGYIQETIGENRYRNVRFDFSMSYDFNDNFTLKGLYTRKGNSNIRGFYQTKNHVSTVKYGQDGFASRGTDDYRGNYGQLTLDYKQTFGKHTVTGLAGYNYEDNVNEGFWATNRRFPTDGFSYNNIGSGQGLQLGEAGMSSYKNSDKLIAFFGRVTYNYDDRYLLLASIRHEGSSRFGEDNKWGNFPGISAGWRIDQEEFMENVDWIDNLKLRAGYGITGINAGSNYQSLSGLTYGDYFLNNGEWIRELVPSRNANPNLRWEKKKELNFGLDFGVLNNRISGSVDYYQRRTEGALFDYSVPTPPYFYGTIAANVAELENSGLEFLLNVTPFETENFTWTANLTYSTNTNKVVSLSNDEFQLTNDFFDQGYTGEPIQIETHRVKEGEPIGNFFGLKSVDITDDGVFLIETPDGRIIPATEATTEDRQILGNGLPTAYYSWNNTVRYKNWDFNMNLRGALDYQILNFSRMFYENPTVNYNVLDSAFDEVYGKAVLNDVQRYVSYYVEDGDFLKIDNVTLGYTLPKDALKFTDSFRIYFSGLNLATFTSYKGIDPEVNRDGLAPGNDERDKYPSTRTFTLGINFTL
ncbi:TonB-linked outer membrane protein, SusC/RagA family [Galbibacter orientalis DSM 19592]|uniref:TonB-linked outer membrane protein, SusC/RagA family n=1 Tax=Galbibacter orientalis DSM 19592 TaxID=926559 RepID=I3C7Q5_9FLAO|nr:TonB-dependent receptor [Galbibacter orientalis]EIJ39648.1 TonB-linked outer membrane protein, SusC/RagA family [Galbibacter orientalis DSM 19592]